jgi:hypothetical protein
MNEDPSLNFLLYKKLFFAFNFLLIFTCFAFSFSGAEDPASFLLPCSLEPCHEKQENLCGSAVLCGLFFGYSDEALKEECLTGLSRGKDPVPQSQDKQAVKKVDIDVQIQVSAALRKMAKPYHPIIIKAATRHEVDPDLVKAIIMAESGYDPQAVSSEGATGLMQLMPRTAEALGVEDAFNPEHNVDGGVRYLRQLLEEFNYDIELSLAAYNVGSSVVRRHQGIPPIKVTQDYIKKVFAYYRYYKDKAISKPDNV